MRCFAIGWSLALASGCAAHTANGPTSGGPARIVTLVPSFADDVYALGAGAQLVAVSAFTDAPQAKTLPRVADAGSVDAEAILALRPTLVIGIPAQVRLTEPLRRARLRVALLGDDTFEQIFNNLAIIGALTNHAREARATIGRLRRETAALQARAASFRRHPALFLVLGSGPIWTAGAGSYISTLIELAGGTNAANDLHAAYGEYSAEALLRRQPDLLVADPATHLGSLLDREPWRSLRAVRAHHLYYVNPDLIERPGPNYNAGIAWLLERIAPLATSAQ